MITSWLPVRDDWPPSPEADQTLAPARVTFSSGNAVTVQQQRRKQPSGKVAVVFLFEWDRPNDPADERDLLDAIEALAGQRPDVFHSGPDRAAAERIRDEFLNPSKRSH